MTEPTDLDKAPDGTPDTGKLKDLRILLVRTAELLFPTGDGRYVDALRSGFERHAEIAVASQAALGDARREASREILALEEALRDVIAPGLLSLLRAANPFAIETNAADHRKAVRSISLTDATSVLAAALAWERRMGAGSVASRTAGLFADDCVKIADARATALEEGFRAGHPPNFSAAAIDVLRLDALVWSLEMLGRMVAVGEIRRHARRCARVCMEAAVDLLARRRTDGPGAPGDQEVDLDDILVIALRVIESDAEEVEEGRDAFIRTVGWDTVDAFGQLAEHLIVDHLEAVRGGILNGTVDRAELTRALADVGRFTAIGRMLATPDAPPVYKRLAAPPLDRLSSLGRAAAARDNADPTDGAGARIVGELVELCRDLDWLEAAALIARAYEADAGRDFGG